MSCGCKSNNSANLAPQEVSENKKSYSIIEYTIKTFLFLLSLTFIPIFIPIMVWLLFKAIVLNKNVDVFPMLLALAKKLKNKDKYSDDEEDINDDVINEDDYEIVDTENWVINNNLQPKL